MFQTEHELPFFKSNNFFISSSDEINGPVAYQGLELEMFPLENLGNNESLSIEVDMDSFSLLCGNLTKLMFMLLPDQNSNLIEFTQSFHRKADCTKKSRYTLQTDEDYKPLVANKERSRFGFHLLKNLRLFKIRRDGYDITFGIHILDDSYIANPLFSNKMLGAICLCLNTAKNHPDWLLPTLNHQWNMEDGFEDNTWNSQYIQRYMSGVKTMENFRINKGSDRVTVNLEPKVGLDFVTLFQAALFHYSEMTVDVHNANHAGQNIHQQCYHGMYNCSPSPDECKRELFQTCKYIIQHAVFSAVTAGTKHRFKGTPFQCSYRDTLGGAENNNQFQNNLFAEVDAIKEVFMSQMNNDFHLYQQRMPQFMELYSNEIILQYDIGIEVTLDGLDKCLYTDGKGSHDNLRKSIFQVNKERMKTVHTKIIDNSLDNPLEGVPMEEEE